MVQRLMEILVQPDLKIQEFILEEYTALDTTPPWRDAAACLELMPEAVIRPAEANGTLLEPHFGIEVMTVLRLRGVL